MSVTVWTSSPPANLRVGDDAGECAPAVADRSLGLFGTAWTSARGAAIRFCDMAAQVDWVQAMDRGLTPLTRVSRVSRSLPSMT